MYCYYIVFSLFQLCLAECNAKKSLELHCSGMKHLKVSYLGFEINYSKSLHFWSIFFPFLYETQRSECLKKLISVSDFEEN